jgi:hypothetical protein
MDAALVQPTSVRDEALGITIPEQFLLRADAAIE